MKSGCSSPSCVCMALRSQPIFVQRKNAKADLSKMDPLTREETETLEMLYRHQREFAVGHGISVHATLPEPFGRTCHPGGNRMGANVRGATANPRSALMMKISPA